MTQKYLKPFLYILFSVSLMITPSCDFIINPDSDEDQYSYDDDYDYWDDDDNDDNDDYDFGDFLSDLFDFFGDDDPDPIQCSHHHDEFIGNIGIQLTINNENPTVKIEVYSGNYDDDYLYQTLTANYKYIQLQVPTGKYAVVAYYKKGKRTIISVDGDIIKVTHDEDSCRVDVHDIELDVEI